MCGKSRLAVFALPGLLCLLGWSAATYGGPGPGGVDSQPKSKSATSRSARVPLPNSIGAAGDSVTQAFDVDSAGALQDNPRDSWSTGTSANIHSQYVRIRARNKHIEGHQYNFAVTGARVSALDGQLRRLAAKRVRYVTVLIGHNDVCTPSIRTMTSVTTFRNDFRGALSHFFHADGGVRVFVSSLLSVYRLWQVMHKNRSAEQTWGPLARRFTGQGICQSMLNVKNTEAQRRIVQARQEAFNAALRTVCGHYSRCRWDHSATFRYIFPATFVSTVDYFHPSIQGQRTLAAITWKQSYWGSGR
jgi:lysophospholipase L1-like esterase